MQEIELPPIGEIVKIRSPYSDFHGAVGFVSDYIETPGNLSILAVCVHISGREDIIVEVECLKWRRGRKKKL
jgi:hypothetical protein